MRYLILAVSLFAITSTAAYADDAAQTKTSASLDISGPQEVGSTTMPSGNYLVTEQTSGKSYSLMVSNKGTMILAPAPAGAKAALAPVAPVVPTTTAVVGATAAPPATGVAGMAGMAAQSGINTSAVKRMVEHGLEKGVTQMIEKDAVKNLGGFLK